MSRAGAVVFGLTCATLLFTQGGAGTARAAGIDDVHSRIGFTLKTRWGQVLDGRFPVYRGDVLLLPDGRRRVSLRLAAREVEILGYPGYSRITRGRGFFDAERFPEVGFVSQPYTEQLIRSGGELAGRLRIRDVERREIFTIEPASCERPGLDCDVVATGVVSRSDYGLDRWGFAIGDSIRFSLRIRTQDPASEPPT